jgi:hypothetical protein
MFQRENRFFPPVSAGPAGGEGGEEGETRLNLKKAGIYVSR